MDKKTKAMNIYEVLFGGVGIVFLFLFLLAMRLYAGEIKEKKVLLQDLISNAGEQVRTQKALEERLKMIEQINKDAERNTRLDFQDIRDRIANIRK